MNETKLLVWGNNNENLISNSSHQCVTKPEQISLPFPILKVTATEKHISFITTNGELYSYGSNIDGRLGVGAKDNFKCHFQNPIKVNLYGKAKQIKSGFSHVCVQLENGDIYSWGLGEYGSLGVGEFRSKYVPTKVLVPPTIKEINCGAMHSSFIDFQGNIYMCGSNQYGQLGVKSPDKIGTPILVPFQHKIKQVACGVFYSLLLTQKGEVYGMGNNKYAQLGLGHKINESIPTLIKQLSGVVKIQAGYHSGALNSMCELFLWGSGSFGELLRPKKFIINCPLTLLQIKGFFGIAISESQKRIFIWGNNTHGQLGNGGYLSYKVPTEMKQLESRKIQSLCCGINFAISILQSDTTKNYYEQSYSPVNIFSSRKQIYEYQSSPRNELNQLSSRRGYSQEAEFKGAAIRQQQYKKQHQSHQSIGQQKSVHFSEQRVRKTTPQKQGILRKEVQQLQKERSYTKSQRNYESLFLNLSKDYESLAKKYRELQVQAEQRQYRRQRQSVVNMSQIQIVNQSLKDEICLAEKQIISTKEELAVCLDKIYFLQRELSLMVSSSKEKEKVSKRSTGSSPVKNQMSNEQGKIKQLQLLLQQKSLITLQLQKSKKQLQQHYQQQKFYSTQIQNKYKNQCLHLNQLTQQLKSLYQQASQRQIQLNSLKQQKQTLIKQHQTLVKQHQTFVIQHQTLFKQHQTLIKQHQTHTIQTQNKSKLQNSIIQQIKQENNIMKQMLVKLQGKKIELQNQIKNMISKNDYQMCIKDINQLKGKVNEKDNQVKKVCIQLDNQKVSTKTLQEERIKLYELIQTLKNSQKENQLIHNKEVEEERQKNKQTQEKVKALEVQLKYQKEFVQKLEQKGKQMDRLRNQACKELERVAQSFDKEKKRRKQLEIEAEKFKLTENQLRVTREQLQKERALNEDYKDKVLKQYKKKDQLIKEMQKEIEEKQAQYDSIIEKREGQISNLKQQAKLLHQKNSQQKQQVRRLNKQLDLRSQDIQNLRDELQKLERKLNHTKDLMEKQIAQREQLAGEVSRLKKDQTKSNLQKQELHRNILQLEKDKTQIMNSLRREKDRSSELQGQISEYEQKLQASKQENNYMRSELDQANAAVEQANKISQQLSNANKEFAENQQNLNKKIQDVQAKIYELQDQNRSYTPRYEALVERNRQLDQRNRELSEMVNKAIEIQAESYKTNILKEVELTSNKIINDVEDEKKFKQRFNRKPLEQENQQPSQIQQHSFSRTPQVMSRVKQQPYTKYMNEKIESHRRRISESAQKLAGILDLQSGLGSAYTKRGSSITKRIQDEQYERINNHMQSLKTQKQAFMQKINSFASKMKLL